MTSGIILNFVHPGKIKVAVIECTVLHYKNTKQNFIENFSPFSLDLLTSNGDGENFGANLRPTVIDVNIDVISADGRSFQRGRR